MTTLQAPSFGMVKDVVQSVKSTSKKKRLDPQARIIPLLEEPPVRKGTDRHRKMILVISCSNVGEALDKLHHISPPIGGGFDIRLAEKVGAIRLELSPEG